LNRAILLPCLLSLVVFRHLQAQDGRFDAATHAGVNADGKLMLGGQVGVRLARFAAARLSGSIFPTIDGGTITNWDASLRIMPWHRTFRPYLLGGVALEHVTQAGFPTRNDWGIAAGAGLEAGNGSLTGFVEARIARVGTVLSTLRGHTDGWFWGGLRAYFGR
jgi:hypothetical protein